MIGRRSVLSALFTFPCDRMHARETVGTISCFFKVCIIAWNDSKSFERAFGSRAKNSSKSLHVGGVLVAAGQWHVQSPSEPSNPLWLLLILSLLCDQALLTSGALGSLGLPGEAAPRPFHSVPWSSWIWAFDSVCISACGR